MTYRDGVLLHGEGPARVVQLEVQATRVAHRLALRVAPPQRRLGGAAVGAHSVLRAPGLECTKINNVFPFLSFCYNN